MNYWDKVLNQFSTMGADVKNLFSRVGKLSDLETKVKSSIVGAINEIQSGKTSWVDIQNKPDIMTKIASLQSHNLNDIIKTGYYYQYNMGNTELNYPANTSGILIVYEAGGIFQKYWTSTNEIYVRVRQGKTKWMVWKKLI